MTAFLYGEQVGLRNDGRIERIIGGWRSRIPAPAPGGSSERDAMLITCGDMIREAGVPPLAALAEFCEHHLAGAFNFVHVLPFYPSSSDEGFSVIDYRSVDPALGSRRGIEGLRAGSGPMLDAVFNHVSVRSAWFRAFLRDDLRGAPDRGAQVLCLQNVSAGGEAIDAARRLGVRPAIDLITGGPAPRALGPNGAAWLEVAG